MKIPDGYQPMTLAQIREHFRATTLAQMMLDHVQLSEAEFTGRIERLEEAGLLQFAVNPMNEPAMFSGPRAAFASHEDAALVARLLAFWDTSGDFDAQQGKILSNDPFPALPPLPPFKQPHWQEALDQKVKAIDQLKMVEALPPNHPAMKDIGWMDLIGDLTALRVADVYSFSAETMHAIMTGAQSIPHESPLHSIEIPKARAGWFWFAEPFPVAPSPIASDTTAALLWFWDADRRQPTLRFSAYVIDTKGGMEWRKGERRRGQILPSAKWLWPLDFSFHDMIGLNTQMYRQAYGPTGPYKDKTMLIGEEATLKVVADLSLFFMMACLWFRQTVPGSKKKIQPKLTQEPGHIERHARKRYEKEFKTKPVVHVIALRKTAAEAVEHTTTAEDKRHLTVRFVVKGHPRLQPCGPGRKDKKLIFIDAYPKGPPDAPFKESGPTVYAVIR